MEFIELHSFTRRLKTRLTDDEYRELQHVLIENPSYGSPIKGGGGLRKIRVKKESSGKSGGVRVIYYWFVNDHQIFLLDIYAKNEKTDLSDQQLKQLRDIIELLEKLVVKK